MNKSRKNGEITVIYRFNVLNIKPVNRPVFE